MTTQTATELADELDGKVKTPYWQAAAMLRSQAAEIERLRNALITLTHSCEKSRIWGGMEWVYHPVHPVHYLPALDAARAALGEGK